MIAGAPDTPETDARDKDGRQGLPFISVAVCTRNQAGLLARSVASVLPQLGPDTELLIVDNASTDETPQIVVALAAKNPTIRVCHEAKPGIPFARNAALLNAQGRYILFFDHDELVDPGWLDAYRSFLKNPPVNNLGCVGGPYIEQHEAPVPTWLDPHYGAYSLASATGRLDGGSTPANGNCAYPTELVVRMGGFHPDVPRQSDTELNLRLRKAGYELWWLESARVRHIIPASRLRFKAQARLWRQEGRDSAVLRWLLRRTRTDRLALVVGRCLAAVLQLVFQFVGSALLFLIFRRRRAARLFFRGCRVLGFVEQLLRLGACELAGAQTPAPLPPSARPAV
jgi:glycosyltransferase involved in cell wall biosynthesis